MNKKTKNALILILLVALCLFVFAGCNGGGDDPDVFDYSSKDLSAMGKVVKWMHSWVGNYGWTVVVFTVFLKIIMLPLDFWQRYASRKSALKMQQMQPVIEGIDKRYGANTQRANEEKQKLYKKQGFSMMSSCLPMILSMVIFFVMFAGLRSYSTYSSITTFQQLSNTYYGTYYTELYENEDGEYYNLELKQAYEERYKTSYESALTEKNEETAKLIAQINSMTAVYNYANKSANKEYYTEILDNVQALAVKNVQDVYLENRESWLWIKNVWQPDTWASVMQPYEGKQLFGGGFSSGLNLDEHPDQMKGQDAYEKIRNAVLQTGGHGKNGSWNGLMILPIMSIGLSFLSMFISQRMEKKNRKGQAVQQNAQQAATSKMMMIIMPLMMAYFGFIYTGAFAIYMVVNYTLSIITTVVMRWPVEKIVTRNLNKAEKKNKSNKATYMR